ncbi:ABC transporter G family member 26 [Capsicum baccatum]|uniref:ABC transporter G family member 26 n=1 Tax=Capsicum baccatum TaxID=33114 RepID=A0A2G2V3C6_CAPBA|nr:ABC transporter G family member 26 [Capsicum baccatum]
MLDPNYQISPDFLKATNHEKSGKSAIKDCFPGGRAGQRLREYLFIAIRQMKFDINKEKDFLIKYVFPSFMLLVPWKVKVPVHDTMEHLRQDEIEDLSLSPPAVGSLQIAGRNGFGHNIEFMYQAYLRNRSSKIDIEVENDTSIVDKDQPLPIFLKFADVEYKVKISQASSNNHVKAVVSKVGFVTQDDELFPQLTIEEAFIFVAFLRLPSKMSRRQKYERAKVIIKELGLERCHHTRLGRGLIKGISGGERKITSIGYEILVDPSLLLLDEPTSGLDSSSSRKEQGSNGRRPPSCDYVEEFFPPFEFSSERVQAIGKYPVSLATYDVYPEAAFLEVAFQMKPLLVYLDEGL